MLFFDMKRETLTPKGKMNFIGAVHKYFDSYTQGINQTTRDTYINRYETMIFPYVNTAFPMSEYSEENLEELLSVIGEETNYSRLSINTDIRHLVYDPCEAFFKDPQNLDIDHYRMWGNGYDFEKRKDAKEDVNAAAMLIRRSLSVKEELLVCDALKDPETSQGELIGLTLMFCSAVRNNEACGLNWGGIREMQDHPGCYYMQIYQTTKIASNALKLGGKTYNAPRQIPVIDCLLDLLQKRKSFLTENISFPYTAEDGTVYRSIDEMPVACHGSSYGIRCTSRNLSDAGKNLLREKVKMSEKEYAGLSYLLRQENDAEDGLVEKDVTTYLLRRNMATHLYTLGMSMLDSQYIMGHCIENTPLKRVDFADEEYLYRLLKIMNKHPLNQAEDHTYKLNSSLHIDNEPFVNLEISGSADLYIDVIYREKRDTLRIENISDDQTNLDVVEKHSSRTEQSEVNVTDEIRKAYQISEAGTKQ